jgi:hypothetical protein
MSRLRIDFKQDPQLPNGEVMMRVIADGTNLFAPSGARAEDSWLPVPLGDMADGALVALAQAQSDGACAIELDETGEALLFAVDGPRVAVFASASETGVVLPFTEVQAALSDFHQRAVAFAMAQESSDVEVSEMTVLDKYRGLLEPTYGSREWIDQYRPQLTQLLHRT